MTNAPNFLPLGNMPLYWRVSSTRDKSNQTIPSRYVFQFENGNAQGLIRQVIQPGLLEILEDVYNAEHNVGYLQDGHMFSKGYGDDLLAFISRVTTDKSVRNAVEIGCGGCYVLERLAAKGIKVMGVDPSPIAAAKGQEKGIRIISDFFPSKEISEKFDLILEADVLEHVANPIEFLRVQKAHLTGHGVIIISVPDCTGSIAMGDVSMALHQHLNYFDTCSLALTVQAAGLTIEAIEPAKYGGSLYCCASLSPQNASVPSNNLDIRALEFAQRAERNLSRFRATLDTLAECGRSVGFYVPLRAAPYLAHKPSTDQYRFFDDTPHWHHQYIDGLDQPIENFAELHADPVDELFIMSLTFGDVIKNKVISAGIPSKVVVLPEFLSDD